MTTSDLIGKPFKDYGRGPAAYDCLGLVREVCRRVGVVPPPDYADLDRQCCQAISDTIDSNRCDYNIVSQPAAYDLVCFRSDDPKFCDHIGIMIDNKYFLHSVRHIGVVKTSVTNAVWKYAIEGFYRRKT